MRQKKKKDDTYKKPASERIADTLNLPKDIVLNLPKMYVSGKNEIFIENYRGIINYSDTNITLNTSGYTLKISGTKLSISSIASEEITIIGIISSIEFI